jgi:hypothetical protein
VLRLSMALVDKASQLQGEKLAPVQLAPAQMAEVESCPPDGDRDKRIRVAGLRHEVLSLNHCLFVSNGPVLRLKRLNNCVVLVNGSIKGCQVIRNSVVICRGDLGGVDSIEGSILLVKGRLGAVVLAESSLFQARELDRVSSSRHNFFLNLKGFSVAWPEGDRYYQTGAVAKAAPAGS